MKLANCLWTRSSCSMCFLVWGYQTGLAFSRIGRIIMLWHFSFTCAGQVLCRNALVDSSLKVILFMWVDHVKSVEIVMPGWGDLLNSGVVNGVIVEHGVVLMSDAHVNTFVWVEVHASSHWDRELRSFWSAWQSEIEWIIEYKMVSSPYRLMLALSGKSLI